MNLTKKMERLVTKETVALLKRIGAIAEERGERAFLVGGPVRDLLLGAKNVDLDIVIVGDAIGVGRVLAAELGGRITAYKKYGTCTVKKADTLKIDLATARRETYKAPAALPAVKRGTLKDDLRRRDFTVNAMAVSLSSRDFGELVDLSGGLMDLKRKTLRVMHDRSFIDDPTRIFRAVRFEERLGFHIAPGTERLIKRAVKSGVIKRLESRRIRNELMLMMKEEKARGMAKRLGEII
jgi:tRNA nucleotidyltransferase (CCA-adding enzyme)